ncbi:MAG: B12-binding domain-containing radical SAM protein [Magnetococcales bacterium]|nr:B12-binding domain-containing radical SAM protein [Magnetococcales bacterium]
MNLPITTSSPDIKYDNSSLHTLCDYLNKQYSISPKLLLVQTPQIDFKTFDPNIAKKKGYYNYPPTGLQYLYESIKDLGIEVRILNLNLEILRRCHESPHFDHSQWMDILTTELESYQPSIVGVSCMFDVGIDAMLDIFKLLKKENNRIVIAGGLIPTHEWQTLLKRKLCHFVVEGEGENKLPFLLSNLFNWQTEKEVPGVHFNLGDIPGESQGPKDVVEFDFDLIESYSQISVEEHYKYGSLNPFGRMAGIDDAPFSAIQLHRGCRAVCTFCSVHGLMGKGVRRRKVATVIDEMAFLIEKKGVKHFEWLDDDLLFYKKEFQALLQIIIDKKWNITWSANNGLIVAAIDEKTMALIKDSGCIGIKLGFESGNQEMLRNVQKPGGTLEKYNKACKILSRYPEVFTGANIIVGFPDEYFFQMMDSFLFYLQSGTDWGAFNTCQTVRGASAFSDFGSYFDAQMEGGGTNVKNFNPARREVSGEVDLKVTILSGYDIFSIDPKSQPSEEQIQEIWFTFNLLGNFIFNKNLKANGRVQNFIGWVEMAQIPYQTNPYMALFLGLAHQIAERPKIALEYLGKTREVLAKNRYWQGRFAAFDLNWVVNDFPQNREATFLVMSELRRRAESYFSTV